MSIEIASYLDLLNSTPSWKRMREKVWQAQDLRQWSGVGQWALTWSQTSLSHDYCSHRYSNLYNPILDSICKAWQEKEVGQTISEEDSFESRCRAYTWFWIDSREKKYLSNAYDITSGYFLKGLIGTLHAENHGNFRMPNKRLDTTEIIIKTISKQ